MSEVSPAVAALVAELQSLPGLIRGTLCPMRRASGKVYHNLQYWHDGRNHTEYVGAERLPLVQAAVANYERFQNLTAQWAAMLEAQTRAQWAAAQDSKKNFRRRSSRPRRRS